MARGACTFLTTASTQSASRLVRAVSCTRSTTYTSTPKPYVVHLLFYGQPTVWDFNVEYWARVSLRLGAP